MNTFVITPQRAARPPANAAAAPHAAPRQREEHSEDLPAMLPTWTTCGVALRFPPSLRRPNDRKAMAKDNTLGSLFGKAKKWAEQEVKNATRIGATPQDQKDAERQNEYLKRDIESDAKQMRDAAIIHAITPQSVKDYQAYTAAQKLELDTKHAAEARAKRVARASASRVELSDYVTMTAEGLAVESWFAEDGGLATSVECIDPILVRQGTITGFCFTIPSYHGDDTYTLVDDPEFNSLAYELYLRGDDEDGWAYHPSYGPGVIVVRDGVADVQLVLGSVGTETIKLHGTIVLPEPQPLDT
jgi:hypothetical protein